MRFAGFGACGLVAWDCAEKALGVEPQSLFAPGAIWAWWIVAVIWAFWCMCFAVSK